MTDPPVVRSVQIIEAGPSSFERGFWAGRESAIAAQLALAVMSVGSIVQNVQIIPSPQLATTFPVFGPFLAPVFPVPVRVHPRLAFAPNFRNRFIHGSGGVFVFGASRPPSMAFFHH